MVAAGELFNPELTLGEGYPTTDVPITRGDLLSSAVVSEGEREIVKTIETV